MGEDEEVGEEDMYGANGEDEEEGEGRGEERRVGLLYQAVEKPKAVFQQLPKM
ncbi:MAG: hypothetical protein JXD23_17655 [Spirochaetales bacterium]|nr:hypothetical protein [Spirochaetales bacterium]